MDEIEEWEAAARTTMDQVRSLLQQMNLRWVDLSTPSFVGGALAIGWSDVSYNVVSVGLGGSEGMVNVMGGVLRDVNQDRLTILDLCNRLTRDNPTFPAYLHDSEAGWDVLLGARLPIGVFINSPDFLKIYLEAQAAISENTRTECAEFSLGGAPYVFNDEDINRLVIKSVL